MARIPDRQEYRRRWASLPFSQRRVIMRAVNRGRALDDKRDAALAVGLARQQQRYWSKAWILGPALGLLQWTNGLAAVAVSAVVATAILGVMSWFWYRRAARAEQLNLAAAGDKRAGAAARRDASASAKQPKSP